MLTDVALNPRPVASTLDALLDELGADPGSRRHFQTAEIRSASAFERVTIGGEVHVIKHLHLDHDFTMRSSGDIGCRTLRAWAAGLFDTAPQAIDHAILGVAGGDGRNGWGAALVMRDVSSRLLPPGDDPFTEHQHAAFIDHLAAMSASTWGWRDDLELLPAPARWAFFGSATIEGERSLGWPEPVPEIAHRGWHAFDKRAPAAVAKAIGGLRRDPAPLVGALRATPWCFLHGDWKAANLGEGRDGRTILLDWVYLGEGPACHELGWYLALNRAKLPPGHTKETVIEQFRSALEDHGVDTDAWWDAQLSLALLGTLVQFGWEKALGEPEELGWWCDRAVDGLGLL